MYHIIPTPKYNLIGHRGTAGLRPENTLCSFENAAELGLSWIEFDIHLTRDNKWIVMHDATLDRTTGAHGLVREHDADQITSLEAGLWFWPPYPNQKVPTLLETLQLAQKLNLFCNIEIKGAEHDPQDNAAVFVEFVQQHVDLIQDKVIVSSFNLPVLIEIRSLLPSIALAYIKDEFSIDMISLSQQYDFSSINCRVDKFAQNKLKLAQDANIPVFLYTVNDLTTARYWIERGITGLFTDRPDLLLSV